MARLKTVAPALVESRIVEVRGEKVLLDADLAAIYGVQTRVLNQAVKRNGERFPGDFVFRLGRKEAEAIRRSRSRPVILKQIGRASCRERVYVLV